MTPFELVPVLRLIRLVCELRALLGITMVTSVHIRLIGEQIKSIESAIPVCFSLSLNQVSIQLTSNNHDSRRGGY